MSKSIDERVVEMKFDNQQFESNVQTSLGTLGKLKEALKFDGASKGLQDISNTAKNVDMSPMGNAVEGVKEKFSVLEQFAIAAVRNIANDVVNMGKRIVNEFTLAPLKDGFAEYELKMGSVQTIMASTGADINTINRYLEELNLYADKTIYSFKDMTASIGKFTNAGVSLDDAVKAIQGVSNEAAVSGANANEASRAMYNFAQALSAGAVKLIDWKSIENANMATVEFKQELMDTAVQLGTLVESEGEYATTTTNLQGKVSGAFTATHAFNESLAHQWMTTDVLIETLSHYSNDIRDMTEEEVKAYEERLKGLGYTEQQIREIEELGVKAADAAKDVKTFSQLVDTIKEGIGSGWAQTFETMFGDLEEAKVLWTGINEVVGGFFERVSKGRNDLLKAWSDVGGRTQLIYALKNAFDGLVSVISPVAEGIREMFPALRAVDLENITYSFMKFTEKMHLSQGAMDGLKNIVKILLTPLKALLNVFKMAASAIGPVITLIGRLADAFLFLFSSERHIDATTRNTVFEIKRLSAIKSIGQIIHNVSEAFQDAKERLAAFVDTLKQSEAGQRFADTIAKIVESIKSLGIKAMTIFADGLKKLATLDFRFPDMSGFVEWVLKGADAISGFFSQFISKGFDAFSGFGDKLSGTTGIFEKLKSAVDYLKNAISNLFSNTMPIVSRIGEMIKNVFTAITGAIRNALSGSNGLAGFTTLLNAGIMVGIGKGISTFIKNLNDIVGEGGGLIEKVKGILDKFGDIGKKIGDVLGSVQSALESFQAKLKSDILMKIALSIAVLAGSLAVLAGIDKDKLTTALVAISGLFLDLIGTMEVFEKTMSGDKNKTKAISKISKTMIGMSAAVLILSFALKKLSDIDAKSLESGLGAITALIIEITTVALVLSNFGKKIETSSRTLIGFSIAIGILTLSVSKLSSIEPEKLGNGLGIITTLLIELTAVALTLSHFKGKMETSALGMIGFAAAIYILSGAVEKLGNLPVDVLSNGLLGLTGVLTVTVMAFNMLKSDAILKSATAMLVFSAAMNVMALALKSMGSMSMDEIGNGLFAFGGAMMFIVVAFRMIESEGVLKTASALLIFSVAMNAMGLALKSMGSMNMAEIGKALIAFGGAMLIVVAAFEFLKSDGILKTSAAMLVMSGAMIVMSGALKLIGSMSIAEIAKGLIALGGAFAIMGVAAAVLEPLIGTILALSGALALLGVAVLAAGVGVLAFSIGLAGLAASGVAAAAAVVGIVEVLVVGFLKTIAHSAEALGEAVKTLVLTTVDVIVSCATEIAEGVMTLIEEVLNSLNTHGPMIAGYLFDFLITIINMLAERVPELVVSVVNLIGNILQAIVDAFSNIDPGVLTTMLEGIGIMAAIMVAMAGLSLLAPAAMKGVLEMGVVAVELTAVLALLGGIAQIPGFQWLIGEGGDLLQGIGTAIGQFVGGIVGGFAEGATATLPQVATNLSDFMTNLQPFIVGSKDIDPATMAGVESLAKMVLTLTAAGILEGLTSWLMGGSSIVKFGQDLAQFGPYLRQYADSVTGLNTGVVEASAIAAQTLADMAAVIPNTGGLVAFFTGDNDIGAFGKQLVKFGMYFAAYSVAVADVNPEVVTATSAAAQTLTELANSVPNTGGLVAFFTGDNDLGAFGNKLATFGDAFKRYYDSVSGIVPSRLSGVTEEFKKLIELFKGMNGIENYFTSGTNAFITAFNKLAESGIEEFIIAFENAESKIQTAVGLIFTAVINKINSDEPTITERFDTSGQNAVQGLIKGMNSKKPDVETAAENVGKAAVTAITNYLGSSKGGGPMFEAGANAALGFAKGIESKVKEISDVAAKLAQSAVKAAERTLDENSPSRVFFGIGAFAGEGMTNGILSFVDRVGEASVTLGSSAVDSIKKAIMSASDIVNDGLDLNPTITPVMDLSNIQNGVNGIDSIFSRVFDISTSLNNADAASRRYSVGTITDDRMPSQQQATSATYNFTQNNYSPKALSRVEIYRQTKNQFSAMKGAVAGT